ncbi:MAG: SDR family NAD(P)-dependent oxidoreductase, partial [Alphaproteobacteria bacterium]
MGRMPECIRRHDPCSLLRACAQKLHRCANAVKAQRAAYYRRLTDRGERKMDVRLDGRTALITGASEGLGLAMARKFAESGANVAMVSRNA